MTSRILKTKQFARWAKREGLSGQALCAGVREIERGLVDARLGGFLLKKRIAKGSHGKSGGLRIIIAYRQGARLIFLFGFAKRDRANLEEDEKGALHKLADIYMAQTEKQLNELVKKKILIEVDCDDEGKKEPSSE
jgi:hypothetical protein